MQLEILHATRKSERSCVMQLRHGATKLKKKKNLLALCTENNRGMGLRLTALVRPLRTLVCKRRLSRWLSWKESAHQCRKHGFDPWVGKIPWRKKWQSTPVFLPGKSHGQRSLVGCSP